MDNVLKMRTVIMKSTLTYLTRLRLWPKSEDSPVQTAYLILVSASFLLIGTAMRVAVVLYKKESGDVVESVENIISQVGVLYFVSFFVSNRGRVVGIVAALADLEKFGKPPEFDGRNEGLERVSRMFKIGLHVLIVGFFVWPLMYTRGCQSSGAQVCGLVTPIWLPFDYGSFPVKHLVYVWQCYCCFVTYGAAGMLSMAMLETMEHLVVKFRHLSALIVDVVTEPVPHIRQKLLRRWVDYHVHLFSIAKAMNDSYRASLSVHVVCAGALFGFIGHKLIRDVFTINSLSLFCGWFASLFVVCVGGQHLMNESLAVSSAVYNTGWYDLSAEFQKDLVTLIIRAQRPLLIHAGPFTYLSPFLILTVLQTAYSYVNLLRVTS